MNLERKKKVEESTNAKYIKSSKINSQFQLSGPISQERYYVLAMFICSSSTILWVYILTLNCGLCELNSALRDLLLGNGRARTKHEGNPTTKPAVSIQDILLPPLSYSPHLSVMGQPNKTQAIRLQAEVSWSELNWY